MHQSQQGEPFPTAWPKAAHQGRTGFTFSGKHLLKLVQSDGPVQIVRRRLIKRQHRVGFAPMLAQPVRSLIRSVNRNIILGFWAAQHLLTSGALGKSNILLSMIDVEAKEFCLMRPNVVTL